MERWLTGTVGGIPRWWVALGLLALLVVHRSRRAAARGGGGPDDGRYAEVLDMPQAKTYRTVNGRAA